MNKDLKKIKNKQFRKENAWYQPYYRYLKKCKKTGEKPMSREAFQDDFEQRKK